MAALDTTINTTIIGFVEADLDDYWRSQIVEHMVSSGGILDSEIGYITREVERRTRHVLQAVRKAMRVPYEPLLRGWVLSDQRDFFSGTTAEMTCEVYLSPDREIVGHPRLAKLFESEREALDWLGDHYDGCESDWQPEQVEVV